jgi:ligand-binding sensor domain-containing protein/two-component sensor histidine kinase
MQLKTLSICTFVLLKFFRIVLKPPETLRKLFLSIIFIIFIPDLITSASFKHLSVEDGLSQSTIHSIIQDQQGFLWFATQDGLNRYDGYRFKVFRHNPNDTNSISHNWIWDIMEDDSHNIWIACWFGLTRFNPQEGTFKRYQRNNNNNQSISGNRTNVVFQDGKKRIWVGTWGDGLNLYQKENDSFKNFRSDSTSVHHLQSNYIRSIFEDSRKNLWISTWGSGLARYNEDSSTFSTFRYSGNDPGLINSNNITSLAEDSDGNMLLGTWGAGLWRFNRTDSTIVPFSTGTNKRIHDNYISSLYQDNQGNLWIGSNSNGLYVFNSKNNIPLKNISNNSTNPASLNSGLVSSIFQDRSGILWVGTSGLNYLPSALNQFEHINHFSFRTSNLTNPNILCFFEDKDEIWIGTDGGGINIFKPGKEGFKVLKNNPANFNSLSHNSVSSITKDDNGHFWIGTYKGGLNRFIPQENKFIRYYNNKEFQLISEINDISCLLYDSREVLWVGTFEHGLYQLQFKEGVFKKVSAPFLDLNDLSDQYIRTLYEDSRGIIWVGHEGGGLSALYPDKDFRIRLLYRTGGNIINDIVNTICEDHRKYLWIGTAQGMISFLPPDDPVDYDKVKFNHYQMQDGLPNPTVLVILKDTLHNLWISTNNGLSKFNISDKTFRNYTIEDGLQGSEFNHGAGLKSSDGTFYFGGNNGFNFFRTENIKTNSYVPPVVITEFRIFDKPQIFEGKNEPISLSYNENFISFEFAALDYTAPGKNHYAYKMEGLEKEWTFAGTRRYANYTNLDPGTYIFKVKGSNNDGLWNETGTSVSIFISPPFWKTWWFILMILFSVALLLAYLHSYKIRQALEMEKLRVKIASDLHDDVGASLTKISMFSDLIKEGTNPARNSELLTRISSLSRELIKTMSDIVWVVDSRKDSIGDLLDRMKELAFSAMKLKNIVISFNIHNMDLKKRINSDVRQNIYLIFKEAVNNIVKHSGASKVQVVIQSDDNLLELKIADNGSGLKQPGYNTTGNGLKNMQLRAQQIKGNFEAENIHGLTLLIKNVKI